MKQDFVNEMFNDIPEAVRNFFEVTIGTITEITMPTTKEEAEIACGQLAANINNALLMPFVGFAPIEGMMRVGSKNAAIVSLLLSGLELISGAGGKFKIERPVEGKTYYNLSSFLITGIGLQSISGTLNDTDAISFSDNGSFWSCDFSEPLKSGEYALSVTVTFDDDSEQSAFVNFTTENSVESFAPTLPENGQSYPSTDLILFSGHGDQIVSVSVTITNGPSFELELTGEIWSASASLAPGEYSATFTATFESGMVMPAFVQFTAV